MPPKARASQKLWARRKISDAEVARTTRQVSPEEADKTILALALQHQLVTRLTSLVAVDKTPSRPEGTPLKLTDLPLNLPAGWDFAKVFGERPQLPKPPAERRADASDVQTAMHETPAACDHARHGQAAEDGDRCGDQDDHWIWSC